MPPDEPAAAESFIVELAEPKLGVLPLCLVSFIVLPKLPNEGVLPLWSLLFELPKELGASFPNYPPSFFVPPSEDDALPNPPFCRNPSLVS